MHRYLLTSELEKSQLEQLQAIRQTLHQYPELSGEEATTAERIVAYLHSFGADEIISGLGGHGVAAIYKGAEPGPTLLLRCELDALPIAEKTNVSYRSQRSGKAHLCGHDGHMATLLGVALGLNAAPPRRGRVILLFQPAEETGRGAQAVLADPRFPSLSPDFAFALHNLPGVARGEVRLRSGVIACASKGLKLGFTGQPAHASAPEQGRSPALAMAQAIAEVVPLSRWRAPLDSAFELVTLVHGRLGEAAFGIAPGYGELWLTLRTASDAALSALSQRLTARMAAIAQAEGMALTHVEDDHFPACYNAPGAVQCVAEAAQALAIPCVELTEPMRFSEDFGHFGHRCCAALFLLGAGATQPDLHQPDYDFPDELIAPGVALFRQLVAAQLGIGGGRRGPSIS